MYDIKFFLSLKVVIILSKSISAVLIFENRKWEYFTKSVFGFIQLVCAIGLLNKKSFFFFTHRTYSPKPSDSDYQYFLYETISELRDKGFHLFQIADELKKRVSLRG